MRILAGTTIEAKALIFDLDGTLVDSTALVARIWRDWAAKHGLDPEPIVAACPGRRTIETVRDFAPAGVDHEAEAAEIAAAQARTSEGLVAVAGAAELIASLPQGRWAIVTSAGRDVARGWLATAGLPEPAVLIAGEDVTAGKPDPEGYLTAAERLGCRASQTVVFEDSPTGLEAGEAAAARVVALATTLGEKALAAHDWITDFTGLSFSEADGGRLNF